MSKNVRSFVRAAVALACVALFTSSDAAVAQNTLSGTWTATADADKPDKIHLSFERRGDKEGRSQMGMSYEFAELQGLTREQAAAGGAVRFSLVREAGRIDCEGSFQQGKGSGTFRFAGNQSFLAAMKSRGFDFEQHNSKHGGPRDAEESLFAATALNVTTALADDLLAADLGKIVTEDLIKAAIFKVDSRFAREMKASGFEGLGLEELVKARIFKIDAEYAAQVARMGYAKESFESLVRMRIFKVTPEFIAEARAEGLTNLTVEDLVKLRIFKIDSEFIRQARAEGVPLEIERLVERRIGVPRRSR